MCLKTLVQSVLSPYVIKEKMFNHVKTQNVKIHATLIKYYDEFRRI
jgi:hypothetical protein